MALKQRESFSLTEPLVSRSELMRLLVFGVTVLVLLFFSPAREESNLRQVAAVEPSSAPSRLQVKLARGDTLLSLLKRHGVEPRSAHDLVAKLQPMIDPRSLRPGKSIELVLDPQERDVLEMGLAIDDEAVRATATPAGWAVARKKLSSMTVARVLHDTIARSFYESGVAAGLTPQHILELAEIYEYDVDFFADVKRGDNFSVLVEEQHYADGSRVRRKIRAAVLAADGKNYEAFYFSTDAGNGSYYDGEGNRLRRTFLRAPLNYIRVSSQFSLSRRHPIFRIARPHEAIDYAAPSGTPVVAIGRGRVVSSGWRIGYGNFVEIVHRRGYASRYGHFSRIAQGVRRGVEVNGGQVIGYVGQTGHATGPHLHFEFLQGGRKLNFLNLKIPRIEQLSGKLLERFKQERDQSLDKLRGKER